MFYSKKLITKKVSTYKLNFTAFSNTMNTEVDDAILPHRYAKLSYNFKVANGALSTGIGFEDLTLPTTATSTDNQRKIILDPNSGIKAIWHYKYFDQNTNKPRHLFMYYTVEGYIYWTFVVHESDKYAYKIASTSIYPNGVPSAINYRLNGEDWMIFSSPADGMWKYKVDYGAEKIEDGPCIASMCLHYERLFAVLEGERNRLAFSANLDPTNWNQELDDGGFIEMQDERGKLNKVVSFNDYIYVFRDFGIARLSAYGDQTQFSVSQLFVSGALIYGNSVCVCGQKIILLTRDGLHSFDGYTMTKLQLGIDKLFKNVKNDNCSTLFYNGKYYLACRLNFDDGEKIGCESYSEGYVNNALVVIDAKTNDIEIYRGIDIASMLMLDDGNICKLVACFNGEHKQRIGQLTNDGLIFGKALKKVWCSPKSDMGYPSKLKRIKQVLVKSKYPCKIKICSEKQQKTYDVKPSEKTEIIKTNVIGEQISVSFISDCANAEITASQAIVEVMS